MGPWIAKRQLRPSAPHGASEDETSRSPMRNQGSSSAFVAMMACNVILLLMLSA
jgi:hypothetical protein